MEKRIFLKAFEDLDSKLDSHAMILVGGGAALLLAYDTPLVTMDVDGLLVESTVSAGEFDRLVKEVAADLKIDHHWFNSYFSTFTYTVSADYKSRLKEIYSGDNLKVYAFGLEDLLIMKCFSGREKDIGHATSIIKKNIDLHFVEAHIEKLLERGVPGADRALEFLDNVRERVGL